MPRGGKRSGLTKIFASVPPSARWEATLRSAAPSSLENRSASLTLRSGTARSGETAALSRSGSQATNFTLCGTSSRLLSSLKRGKALRALFSHVAPSLTVALAWELASSKWARSFKSRYRPNTARMTS